MIQLAELDLAEERFGPALNRLREQLDRTSESAAMRFMIGRVHAVQEDWENAEKELKEAIQLDPNFLYAHSLLANVYVDSNRLPQALASLEAFVTNNSDNLGALISLGQMYLKNGESEKAKKTYEKILTLSPNSIVALNNLAWLGTNTQIMAPLLIHWVGYYTSEAMIGDLWLCCAKRLRKSRTTAKSSSKSSSTWVW